MKEIARIRRELSKLRLLLENTKARRKGFAAQVRFKRQMFCEVQAELNMSLAESFMDAALLGPEEEEPQRPVEVLEVEAEYQKLCRMAQEDATMDR